MPYRIVDGVKFYDKREIRDLIAYLRFIFSDSDRLAFERIINLPKRGIGDKTLANIFLNANSGYLGLTESMLKMCQQQEFSPKIKNEIGSSWAGSVELGYSSSRMQWRSSRDGQSSKHFQVRLTKLFNLIKFQRVS